jgi:hypothetical protein
MTTWIAVGAMSAAGIFLFALAALLWVRLSGYRTAPAFDAESGSEFTLNRYRPIARLLAEEDLDFLRQFESCRPQITARWARDRRRILRLYLHQAAADFRRLHAEARSLVANAPEQHADLVGVVMRQQVTFWRILGVIELRLALSGLGLGKVDGSKILATIEAMQAEVRRSMTPISA